MVVILQPFQELGTNDAADMVARRAVLVRSPAYAFA
jgi:hypothetical protein